MSTETEKATALHGGRLVAKRLGAHGVSKLFTLSGGHLFSIYDGCREEGIDIVDTRHEQAAAFAAEGWAKATREPGICALTAGPGVTNGMSALASAFQNGSPMLALGGRAPAARWGQGSLQEIDHVPFVSPVTKLARTADATAGMPALIDEAIHAAVDPPSGPTFLDFPLDQVFMEADVDADAPASLPDPVAAPAADGIERAAELLRGAARPVVMAGTGLYWAHAEQALREICDELQLPVFLNGLARGCVAADHELFFSRARGTALKGADLALVVGVPMDFRLGFGGSFGEETQIVVIGSAPPANPHPREPAAELFGGVSATLEALRQAAAGGPDRSGWLAELRETENEKRAGEQDDLNDDRAPLHPLRVYHELQQVLDRDAVVIGDGGDFVSYAGRVMETYEPGCWMDPGPYGCLGAGPGYALAAKLARPGS
ncbi:MAG: acetolactate synthase, partial [Thermoleophilaceae bacterium]